jgi:hypothetical protein
VPALADNPALAGMPPGPAARDRGFTVHRGGTMIAILTILIALPLGLLIRNRLAAYLTYAIAFGHVYTFQTANLVMEWTNGATAAFPASDSKQLLDGTLGYFTFTTMIYAAGFGLIALGHWLRNRRRAAGDDVRLDRQSA